jgi:hypothetical protein
MNNQMSIYIPRMSIYHSEESISLIFNRESIGFVSYIDFTSINKKPGFCENILDDVKSAFVHFTYTFKENYKFWSVIEQNKPYKLYINGNSNNDYWICLKNKNPVQRTYMNIHQVVENGRYLEKLIKQQNDEINSLREIVKNQQKKINGIDNVVYQLIGGLFNSDSQMKAINNHYESMGIDYYIDCNDNNNSKWVNSPTTRQGDSNEERIEKLEKIIEKMNNFNYQCFDDDYL